jgi:hypothetical protein
VDADSLGRSLHKVGDCYAGLGKPEEATLWYERAGTATQGNT